MSSAAAVYNEEVAGRFRRVISAKRLAHAYLFTGSAGSGKMDTARLLARLVNCEAERACGECPSCRKMTSGNHPDVHVIGDNDEAAIKIDEIRQMLGRIGLRAFEAKVKVFIIKNIERMTTEAANALLKTLEEPAANTLMILTTAVPEACLDTVKSRCQAVKFFSRTERLPEERDRTLDVFLSRGGNEEYFKALGSDVKKTGEAMLVLLSWLRDVLLLKNGIGPERLHHAHRLQDMQAMARRDMRDLSALQQQIVRVKALAAENLNVKMALSLVRERLWGN